VLNLRPSGLDCRRSDPVDSLDEPTSRRRAAATRIQTFVSSPGSASHDTSRTSLRPSSISTKIRFGSGSQPCATTVRVESCRPFDLSLPHLTVATKAAKDSSASRSSALSCLIASIVPLPELLNALSSLSFWKLTFRALGRNQFATYTTWMHHKPMF